MRPISLDKIIEHAVSGAVDEQAEGFSPEPALSDVYKKGRLRSCQIWCPRMRTETIMIKMLDGLRRNELYRQHLKSKDRTQSVKKIKKRKRRKRSRIRVSFLK